MSKIFFVRHAEVGLDLGVSNFGRQQLKILLQKLGQHGFKPKVTITTKAKRCIETGEILAPDSEKNICNELPYSCIWKNHEEIKSSLLKMIEPYIKRGEDVLVVVHDCIPTIMALHLVEKRDVEIPWAYLPSKYIRLKQSTGFLVEDKVYSFISSYE